MANVITVVLAVISKETAEEADLGEEVILGINRKEEIDREVAADLVEAVPDTTRRRKISPDQSQDLDLVTIRRKALKEKIHKVIDKEHKF